MLDGHGSESPSGLGERHPGRAVLVLVVASMTFGALAGFTLTWSAPAWWTVQAIGILAAVAAGFEDRRLPSAAGNGALAGLVAAAAVVGVHVAISAPPVVDFNPVSFPVYATAASAALRAGGAVLRRRVTAKSPGRPS